MKKLSIIGFSLVAAVTLFAAGEKVKITSDAKDYQAKVGSEVTFTIALQGKEISSKELNVEILGNRKINKKTKVTTDSKGISTIKVPALQPGFIYVRAGAKGIRSNICGIAVEPEKIQPGAAEPADFEAYWQGIKAKWDATPMKAELTPCETKNKNISAFRVKLDMGGKGKDAYGAFSFPKGAKPKSLPAYLYVFGAGTDWVFVNEKLTMQDGGWLLFALNTMPAPNYEKNGMLINKRVNKNAPYAGYQFWGQLDRDKIFFNAMYQRVYRALQFLKSRPEWDGRILVVRGNSQGGGQTLAAAGLDPQVSCIVAFVPAMCNHHGTEAGGISGWPHYYRTGNYRKNKAAVLKAASYIDAVNFARRIKADTYITTGYIDMTCPSESVYAAFNVIPAKNKIIVCAPGGTHRTPHKNVLRGEKFISDHRKKMEKK